MASSIRKIFFFLLFIVFFFIVMHFLAYTLSPSKSAFNYGFNMDLEGNVPTWYSTVLLFSVSLISLGIYMLSYDNARSRRFWLVFSCVYSFLSMDEAAQIHESITSVTSVYWIKLYAPLAGAFFVMCAYHLVKSGNRKLRNWILGGLVVYALGGLAFETVAWNPWYRLPPFLYQIDVAFEEGFELLGTIMVLTGCLQELDRLFESVKITKTAP
jgi:hypothetical protein